MCVCVCVCVHLLLQLPPEPAGLRSRQESTTEHFTKCGWEGLGPALGGVARAGPGPLLSTLWGMLH